MKKIPKEYLENSETDKKLSEINVNEILENASKILQNNDEQEEDEESEEDAEW